MTPEEIIATKLLGWEPYIPKPLEFDDDVRALYHNDGELVALFDLDPPCLRAVAIDGSTAVGWPDLTNWNDIRRMEDALFSQIRLGEEMYGLALTHAVKGIEDPEWPVLTKMHKVSWSACLHATPAQRVQAALRVIEEADL